MIEAYNWDGKNNKTKPAVSSSNIKAFDFGSMGTSAQQRKIDALNADTQAMIAKDAKFNFKRDVLGVVKGIPSAAKQLGKEIVNNPIDSLITGVTAVSDAGIGAVNTIRAANAKSNSKLPESLQSPFTKPLPYLTEAFTDTIDDQTRKDSLNSLGEGVKQAAGYAISGGAVKGLGITNKITRAVTADVASGQLLADPNSTLNDRAKQAAFDAAFGLVTEGVGIGYKKLTSKGVPELPKVDTTPPGQSVPERLALPTPKEPVYLPIRSGVDFYAGPNGISPDKKLAGQGAKKLTQQQLDRIENAKPVYDTVDGNLYTPYEQLPVITADGRVRVPKNEFNVTKENSKQTITGKPEPQPSVKADTVPNVNTGDVTLPKIDTTTGLPMKEKPKAPSIVEKFTTTSFDPKTATPEFKAKVVDTAKILEDTKSPFNDSPLDTTPGRKIRQAAMFEDIMSKPDGEDTIKKYINGELVDSTMSAQAAHASLEKYYIESLSGAEQIAKINELVPNVEKVVSKSGQILGDLNQGLGSESPSLNLSKAKAIKEKFLTTQGLNMSEVNAEIKKSVEKAMQDLNVGKDKNKIISDLLDSFSC